MPADQDDWMKTIEVVNDLLRRMRETGRFPLRPGNRRGDVNPKNFGVSMGGGQPVRVWFIRDRSLSLSHTRL